VSVPSAVWPPVPDRRINPLSSFLSSCHPLCDPDATRTAQTLAASDPARPLREGRNVVMMTRPGARPPLAPHGPAGTWSRSSRAGRSPGSRAASGGWTRSSSASSGTSRPTDGSSPSPAGPTCWPPSPPGWPSEWVISSQPGGAWGRAWGGHSRVCRVPLRQR